MIYEFKCTSCHHTFSKEFPDDAFRVDEPCAKCGSETKKLYGLAPRINIITGFQADYYYGLGKAFTTKRELDYHLDKNNLTCVGNDFGSGERMLEIAERDKARAHEADWEKTLENIKL